MSADDENKISENRRRLFKALSTAPVVMTLRPGQALANASAFQCLSTPPTATTPVYLQPLPGDCSEADAGCLAYVERVYFDNLSLSNAQLNYWNRVIGNNSIIVQTDLTDPSVLYVVNMDTFAGSPFDAGANGFALDSNNNLLVPVNSGGANPVQVAGQTGYFLYEVTPTADLMGIQEAFAYPQATQDPLARSCGTSLGVEATNGLHWVQG